jgi:NitT/TauT family transport system substrate-binding protein
MPERRRFLHWTGAGLAVVGTPMVRSQTGTERNRVTVTVAGGLSLANLPLSVALHRGFFGQEGLDVDFVESLDEAQSQQAFLSGGTELVCGPYEQTMRLQARGKPGVAFVMLARVPKVVFGISTRKHATLRALTDFRGQLVGYGGAGTTSELVARQVLSRAGLRPTEVQWQAVADAVTGLHGVRSGQLDAWCNGDPAMTQLEQRSEVRVLSDTRTLRGTAELFGGPMPGLCLYATSAFLQRNPRHAQAPGQRGGPRPSLAADGGTPGSGANLARAHVSGGSGGLPCSTGKEPGRLLHRRCSGRGRRLDCIAAPGRQ